MAYKRSPEARSASRNRRQQRNVKRTSRQWCPKCNGTRWSVELRFCPVSRDNTRRVAVPCSCTRPAPLPDFKARAAGDVR